MCIYWERKGEKILVRANRKSQTLTRTHRGCVCLLGKQTNDKVKHSRGTLNTVLCQSVGVAVWWVGMGCPLPWRGLETELLTKPHHYHYQQLVFIQYTHLLKMGSFEERWGCRHSADSAYWRCQLQVSTASLRASLPSSYPLPKKIRHASLHRTWTRQFCFVLLYKLLYFFFFTRKQTAIKRVRGKANYSKVSPIIEPLTPLKIAATVKAVRTHRAY